MADRVDSLSKVVESVSARLDALERAVRDMNVALVRTQGWVGVVAEGKTPLATTMRARTKPPPSRLSATPRDT